MSPACQEKNVKGLTMVAVGMNKAADELLLLDDSTREDLASGKHRDPRRGFFGASGAEHSTAAPPGSAAAATAGRQTSPPIRRTRAQRPRPAPASATPARRPWTDRQERLALLYNQQGLRPGEIARKLGVSTYLATQIILAARNRANR